MLDLFIKALIGMALGALFIFTCIICSAESKDNHDCKCGYIQGQIQSIESKYDQLEQELYETIIDIMRLKAEINKEEKIIPRPDVLKPELY